MVKTKRAIKKKVKKRLKIKRRFSRFLRQYHLEKYMVHMNFIYRNGEYYNCMVFSHKHKKVSHDIIKTQTQFDRELKTTKMILFEPDDTLFDSFEDLRKYILIKKLSGIE